jgi:hypothetical protein
MRTASRVLGFAVGAVALSVVFVGGTAQAAQPDTSAPATATVSCPSNMSWDGTGCAPIN